jgi:rhodanese-related sulfurtransferase
MEGLNREKAYLIVCRSGVRSAQACHTFVKHGFKNITNLEGGLMAWKTNQNPEMDVI